LFEETHEYYRPALVAFDIDYGSTIGADLDCGLENDSSDSSGWGSPFVNIELEQRKKQGYDEFWRNAGFV
jgi:hypothetical protein